MSDQNKPPLTPPTHSAAPGDQGVDEDRRGALKTMMAVGGAAFGCGALIPAARLVVDPILKDSKGEERWYRVARLADLQSGQPKRAAVIADKVDAWTLTPNERLGAVWLLRDRDEVRALAATCPHLGCAIDYSPEAKKFNCPCHTTDFDADGKKILGPSPRDMDPIETRVVGTDNDRAVEVKFKMFRQGIQEREEVG